MQRPGEGLATRDRGSFLLSRFCRHASGVNHSFRRFLPLGLQGFRSFAGCEAASKLEGGRSTCDPVAVALRGDMSHGRGLLVRFAKTRARRSRSPSLSRPEHLSGIGAGGGSKWQDFLTANADKLAAGESVSLFGFDHPDQETLCSEETAREALICMGP